MPVGTVYLVGAGPGDPGLLTLRGWECLQRADLVLYDGLVNPLILRHTLAEAQRTCRTESRDGRVLEQDEINRRLIEAARAGQTVVRLKGGDPFIFGRGGEEAAALAAAGVPFEVVPGISAATAAAEYAGISLTHRRLASAVAFVTGHEHPAKGETSLDYGVLARFPGTLVFYMGLHRLPGIVAALIAHGKDAATPACVISRATLPAQQVVSAALADLPASAAAANLRPPSLIVVGECVRQREQIAWFEHRPLFGRRIGITRPAGQAAPQISRALELGAEPVLLPVIEIRPPDNWSEVDRAISQLQRYDWIVFTSANGVAGFLGRLWETGGDARRLGTLSIAAIGPSTAEALEEYRLRADLVPDAFRAEALAEALVPHVSGRRVLWARASRGRDVLPEQLAAAGATVDQLVVYQNIDAGALPDGVLADLEAGRLDWIGLSSPSIARSLKRLLPAAALQHLGSRVRLASISPVTSAAARECGLPIAAEAESYTWEGIFAAIEQAEGAGATP
ncbi:MAG: uroporphyrinogen-III C-methyltransferase [Planctomycetes bacterium]|nr:uroporphyrinogen-III C-methyltransferase [Planctomycetota bacterium]